MRPVIVICLFATTGLSFPGYVTTLELRLNTPLTSFEPSTPQSKFDAVVIAPGMVGKRVFLP